VRVSVYGVSLFKDNFAFLYDLLIRVTFLRVMIFHLPWSYTWYYFDWQPSSWLYVHVCTCMRVYV